MTRHCMSIHRMHWKGNVQKKIHSTEYLSIKNDELIEPKKTRKRTTKYQENKVTAKINEENN